MTYELIAAKLEANHFYCGYEKTGDKITALTINCPAIILMEDKVARLGVVLDGIGVKITPMKNDGYILIKKINSKK